MIIASWSINGTSSSRSLRRYMMRSKNCMRKLLSWRIRYLVRDVKLKIRSWVCSSLRKKRIWLSLKFKNLKSKWRSSNKIYQISRTKLANLNLNYHLRSRWTSMFKIKQTKRSNHCKKDYWMLSLISKT